MTTAVRPHLRPPLDRDSSSASPARTRSRTGNLLSTGSKLVKHAVRESRFVPAEEFDLGRSTAAELLGRDGVSGSGGSGGMSLVTPPRRSGETAHSEQELEAEPRELVELDWYEKYVPTGGLEPQLYAREPQYLLSYSHSSLNWYVPSSQFHLRVPCGQLTSPYRAGKLSSARC